MILPDALIIAAQCFSPVSAQDWDALCESSTWSAFASALAAAAGSDSANNAGAPASNGPQAALAESLDAIAHPLPFAEKEAFARRHFTGGLPDSAMPVESLYLPLGPEAKEPSYNRESAQYMRDLLASLQVDMPAQFAAYPDHLALELETAALLGNAGLEEAMADFLITRFAWLSAYRARLEAISTENRFYVGLADVLAHVAAAFRAQYGRENN